MRNSRRKSPLPSQHGFSMVEMLMTAFILAVGIMGLTLLQVMALKGARGGKSLSTAVQVGETVMDQIETEGRLSWLNQTSNMNAGVLTLQYVNKATLTVPLTFTTKGEVPIATAPDPVDAAAFYSVNFRATDLSVGAAGIMTNFVVTVTFSDAVNPATGLPINRQVVLSRSILHG